MTTTHITKDLPGQFDVKVSDSKIVLDKGVTIDSAANGIDESVVYSGDTFIIQGTIRSLGQISSGISSRGANATVTVAETGRIDATFGIAASGDGSRIVNHGRIETEGFSVAIGGDGMHFINDGTIVSHADRGLYCSQVTDFSFRNDGRISSDHGLYFNADHLNAVFGEESVVKATNHVITTNTTSAETARIVNHGTLVATAPFAFHDAINGGTGVETVRNDGVIKGQVVLGDGADRYDGRGGLVTDGVVEGGTGNDRFFLSDNRTLVNESIGGGYDRLTVSFSYTLAASNEIEEIRLAGKGDFNLTGNGLGSYLQGNAGDNRLSAGAGSDQLFGGRGDDILTGGADMDSFLFKPHAGREVITDFTDGEDLLVLFAGKDITDVQDLLDHHVKQLDGGLLISGDGTEMFLKGMHKADLGLDDFTS